MEYVLEKPIQLLYLDMIKSGKKKYEGRLKNKIIEWDLRQEKLIKFYDVENKNSWVLCKIIELKIYKDFSEAYDELGQLLIPALSKLEVVRLYNNLFHDIDEIVTDKTSNMISRNGVVAIGICVLDKY